MKNILLTETAYQIIKPDMMDIADRVNVLRIQADGSLELAGQTVSVDDYPIHGAWFSHDIVASKLFGPFVKPVMAAPELEWMQSMSAGLDAPFFKQVFDKGVRLTNSDAQAPAIAEYVIASVLNHYQRFAERSRLQADKTWATLPFREISGSNWLVIGFGNIGKRVGEIARGFHANVTGVKRSARQMQQADRIVTYASLDEELANADVVVLTCALTDDTRGLIDAAAFARMKSSSVLVNIARGDVIDESAMIKALNQDAIDHAILDVFATEPLPLDSPLWRHPRVSVTSHASYAGTGTQRRGELLFLENLKAFVRDEPLRNEVDASFF